MAAAVFKYVMPRHSPPAKETNAMPSKAKKTKRTAIEVLKTEAYQERWRRHTRHTYAVLQAPTGRGYNAVSQRASTHKSERSTLFTAMLLIVMTAWLQYPSSRRSLSKMPRISLLSKQRSMPVIFLASTG